MLCFTCRLVALSRLSSIKRSPRRGSFCATPLSKHPKRIFFNWSVVMKLSATVTAISLAASFSTVLAVRVGYDTVYDNPNGSLSTIACSDGSNGMLTKGYTTFDSLPSFPNIGATQAIVGWNSPACGSCWQISYGKKTIYFTAIDHTNNGFVASSEAMNGLTNGQAQSLGVIDANTTQVAESFCGL